MNTHATQSLDARGMNCPLPILRTKKALSALGAGETLAITVHRSGLAEGHAGLLQTNRDMNWFRPARIRASLNSSFARA